LYSDYFKIIPIPSIQSRLLNFHYSQQNG